MDSGNAWVVHRHNREFISWQSFHDSVTEGATHEIMTKADKALSADDYKQMKRSPSDLGWDLNLKPKALADWQAEPKNVPDQVKSVLKKGVSACNKTITEARDIFK